MSHIVEEGSGPFVRRHDHTHNGYYAGDFSAVPFTAPDMRLLSAASSHAA